MLIVFSFFNKKYMHQALWLTNAYLAIRQQIRLYDFENTKPTYENMEDWYFLVMMQTNGMISCMTNMFNYFKGSIKTVVIGLALIIFGLISMLVGIYDKK